LSGRAEETINQAFGDLEKFQKYLNGHSSWMFQQAEKKWINGKWVVFRPSPILLSEKVMLVLAPPKIASDGKDGLYYYNRVISVRTPNREDREEALAGREVTEQVEVEPDMPDRPLGSFTGTVTAAKRMEEQAQETAVAVNNEVAADQKPAKPVPVQNEDRQKFLITPLCPMCSGKLIPKRGTFCQSCGAKLPDECAVHREIAVAIRRADYQKLAEHLRQGLNVAWSQLKRGRKVEETASMGVNIFLITLADEMRTSTVVEEKRFDELLVETGIGRVTTDQYEIKEAHKMLASAKPTQ
jgi:hypothetical protein